MHHRMGLIMLSEKRKKYYAKIYVYKQRREGFKANGKKEQLYHTTKKISQWNNEIRRIDKRNSIINDLISAVNSYFEVNIKSRIFNKVHKLARNVFYKYGMENRIQGAFLSLSLGRTRKKTASECRLRFTRSFGVNQENKDIYHRFKAYMQGNEQKVA